MRCLTLFANVETKANLDNHNTREEYKDLVSIIDQTFCIENYSIFYESKLVFQLSRLHALAFCPSVSHSSAFLDRLSYTLSLWYTIYIGM